MITKLAEEKESKAREGMKMMGLNDKTYFVSWFIFMFGLICIVSVSTIISARFVVFRDSNPLLIFALSILYGMNLFGFSFTIVAFLPSKKSAATFATLIHILTFFVAFIFKGDAINNNIKMVLSLIPNCALSFTVSHLFHSEHQGTGLDLE
jgi:ATP-binding cassette subfamily A (ABC1) protein 3